MLDLELSHEPEHLVLADLLDRLIRVALARRGGEREEVVALRSPEEPLRVQDLRAEVREVADAPDLLCQIGLASSERADLFRAAGGLGGRELSDGLALLSEERVLLLAHRVVVRLERIDPRPQPVLQLLAQLPRRHAVADPSRDAAARGPNDAAIGFRRGRWRTLSRRWRLAAAGRRSRWNRGRRRPRGEPLRVADLARRGARRRYARRNGSRVGALNRLRQRLHDSRDACARASGTVHELLHGPRQRRCGEDRRRALQQRADAARALREPLRLVCKCARRGRLILLEVVEERHGCSDGREDHIEDVSQRGADRPQER